VTLDLMFTSHNRLEFTRASLRALWVNTNWELVRRVYFVDDASIDGTRELVDDRSLFGPHEDVEVEFVSSSFGGPVAAMNYVLDRTDAHVLAKIDNDVIVCPGWLDAMLFVLNENRHIDALGMEPGFADRPGRYDIPRGSVPARWIGGVGLMKTALFKHHRPKPHDRYFGLTAFWRKYAHTAWIAPDLPVFLLDHLPFEPWLSLTDKYVREGWCRAWPDKYPEDWSDYWSWWTAEREAVA
jgi:glycosyltransferase involved in cell wall biosynthesis